MRESKDDDGNELFRGKPLSQKELRKQ
jgi:hypothetical protein